MPQYRAVLVVLSAGDRKTLKKRARGAKTAHQDWLRAQIVLAAARASAMRSGHAPAAARHRVPALIVRVRPIATLRQSPFATGPATLSVRWRTPWGSSRTGQIAGRADAAPGSRTAI